MVTHLPGHWAWGVEWIWVGGYSAAATTILLLNILLFVSIIRQGLPPSLPPYLELTVFLSFPFLGTDIFTTALTMSSSRCP